MAKGMQKRGRDVKKPKKAVAKTNASNPSTKVDITTMADRAKLRT